MKITISLTPDVIRARVQAQLALHRFVNGIDREPLTADHDAALNQSMAFAFGRAVVRMARWVDNYTISPADYHDNPAALLSLEVVFDFGDAISVPPAATIRTAFEEFIAAAVLAELYPDCDVSSLRAADALDNLVSLLDMASLGSLPRLARS